MKTFKSWQDYFQYERALKHEYRYIHTPEVEAFLQAVLETAESRIEIIAKDGVLWRAQLGHDNRYENEEVGEVPSPYNPERMCPRTGRAMEGRVNPKGIPYLYLASHQETALAEVRPWIGAKISVGQFKTHRELKIVNCTTERSGTMFYCKEPDPKEREEVVWAAIDRAFAKPVSPNNDVADYTPTQVIGELFKANGFDGVGYRSSLGEGHNIVIFDISAAEIINCFLFEVRRVKFDFEQAANPYFLPKH